MNASADLTGESESESGADVFVAAPPRGSDAQSAPVAGYFGTVDDASFVRMWMLTRTKVQMGERGDGDGDGDEGGAGTDTWVDTDTDADADAEVDADDGNAYGLWPGEVDVD